MTVLNMKQWWENQRRRTTNVLDWTLFHCHLINKKRHLNYPGHSLPSWLRISYMGADKSLARPGRKLATTREDFDVNISYL